MLAKEWLTFYQDSRPLTQNLPSPFHFPNKTPAKAARLDKYTRATRQKWQERKKAWAGLAAAIRKRNSPDMSSTFTFYIRGSAALYSLAMQLASLEKRAYTCAQHTHRELASCIAAILRLRAGFMSYLQRAACQAAACCKLTGERTTFLVQGSFSISRGMPLFCTFVRPVCLCVGGFASMWSGWCDKRLDETGRVLIRLI